MFRVLLCSVAFTLTLAGCVKKASYNKTGKPVNVQRVNNDEAARTRIALGLQYLKLGEMSNAKYNLEKAMAFSPNLPAVHTAMAHYYQSVGEFELTEKAFVKALSFDGNDPDTLNNYGAFLCRIKRYEQAEQTFLKAIKIPSYLKVAESYENAALCAMENNQFEKAKQYFASSLDHSALRANTLINMAGLSYAMGEYRDAQKFGQRLQNIGVVSPRVLLLRALTELKLGNVTQSKKHGTTLVSLYVKSSEALMYLSKSFDGSEFEQLRRIYLKHQYEKLKEHKTEQKRIASSQDKIKKKLKPKTATDNTTPKAAAVNMPESTVTQQTVTEPSSPATAPRQMVSLIQPQPDRVDSSKPNSVPKVASKATPNVAPKAAQKAQQKVEFVSLINRQPIKEKPNTYDPPAEQVVQMQQKSQDEDVTEVAFHILQTGEFLYDVSIKYNIRMKRLMEWNNITNQNKVFAGQKIYLGESRFYHVIDNGDTLYKISVKYQVAVEKLLQWNKLTLDSRLTLGQKILIVDPEQHTL